MSMGSGGGIRDAVAEINVTPLIDVLLVLLIIFMVIVPNTPKGLNALIPQSPNAANNEVAPRAIVVEVLSHADGLPTYKINDSLFAKSAIESKLVEIFAARQEKVMFVKGDPELLYANVAEVVDLGHRAGVDNIGIITPSAGNQ